jgi:hypothetical protein
MLHHATKKQHRVFPYAVHPFTLGDLICFSVKTDEVFTFTPYVLVTIQVKVAYLTA